MPEREPAATPQPGQLAMQDALARLLRPLAQLALAHGVQHRNLDAALRQIMVDEAQQMLGTKRRRHGAVSAVSMATGLTRREVSRLLQVKPGQLPAPQSLASEVFTRWLSDPAYRHHDRPRELPRSGESPSFEALARSVTQDVHPRALLEELCRLDLAAIDEQRDTVRLQKKAFVPRADGAHMLSLLTDNVSDHFNAAVTNVLGQGREHFEQAVYADELSTGSVQALRPRIAAQWSRLLEELVPLLEQRVAEDRAAGRAQNQRLRIGYYSYSAPVACGTESPAATDGAGRSSPPKSSTPGVPE